MGRGLAMVCAPQDPGRVTCDDRIIGDVLRYNTSSADGSAHTDSDAAKHRGSRTDRGALFHQSRHTSPVGFRLQISLGRGRPRIKIVDENDTMPNEDLVFDLHAFANEGMAGDFAAVTHPCAFLYFYKGPYFDIVTDFTPVQIGKGIYFDIFPQLDIGSDALKQLLAHIKRQLYLADA